MRGADLGHHHDQAGLGARLGRPARVLTALVAIALGAVPVPASPAWAQAAPPITVPLPTAANAVPATNPLEPLVRGREFETKIPGSVADSEEVLVAVGPGGGVRSVLVTQRLTISGTGDFFLRIPGPADDVRVLPGSEGVPGLRRGSVLWQGFAAGRKVLLAEVTLSPASEASRLPLHVALVATVGGKPAVPGARGRLSLSLRVDDRTAAEFGIARADADPARLAPILDRIRAVLAAGKAPQPGRDGVPPSVPVTSQPQTVSERIEVPFSVRAVLEFPSGAVGSIRVRGGLLHRSATSDRVEVDRLLGGGSTTSLDLTVSGETSRFAWPTLTLVATPSPPLADTVAPPSGKIWTALVANDPGAVDGRHMLELIMDTMWQTARLRQFDAYFGNPDRTGPAHSRFVYSLAPPAKTVALKVVPSGASPIGMAAVALIALALLFLAGLAWANA